jgi:hypothetical protein
MAETPAPAALWLASFRTTDGPPEVNFGSFQPGLAAIHGIEQGTGTGREGSSGQLRLSAQLSMELVFDTTDSGRDVRLDTGEIAAGLARLQGEKTPRMVEFSWGTYSFTGVIEQVRNARFLLG